jgi:hypothetical protein
MRHQGEGLEHHAHVVQAKFDQFVLAHFDNVLAVYQHLARSGFDEPVEHAHDGGFSGAGQSHDHKYFP